MLIHLIIGLIIIGLAWWLLRTYILPKICEPLRTIIIVLLALAVVLWLLSLLQVIPAYYL